MLGRELANDLERQVETMDKAARELVAQAEPGDRGSGRRDGPLFRQLTRATRAAMRYHLRIRDLAVAIVAVPFVLRGSHRRRACEPRRDLHDRD
jgi:hypothetical protein